MISIDLLVKNASILQKTGKNKQKSTEKEKRKKKERKNENKILMHQNLCTM